MPLSSAQTLTKDILDGEVAVPPEAEKTPPAHDAVGCGWIPNVVWHYYGIRVCAGVVTPIPCTKANHRRVFEYTANSTSSPNGHAFKMSYLLLCFFKPHVDCGLHNTSQDLIQNHFPRPWIILSRRGVEVGESRAGRGISTTRAHNRTFRSILAIRKVFFRVTNSRKHDIYIIKNNYMVQTTKLNAFKPYNWFFI